MRTLTPATHHLSPFALKLSGTLPPTVAPSLFSLSFSLYLSLFPSHTLSHSVPVSVCFSPQLHSKVCVWLVQLDAVCASTQAGKTAPPPVDHVLRQRSEVLLQGVLMANASGRLFRDLLSLHLFIEKRT